MAQLVEQLICNQQVVGSSPTGSSKMKTPKGRFRLKITGGRSPIACSQGKHLITSIMQQCRRHYWELQDKRRNAFLF